MAFVQRVIRGKRLSWADFSCLELIYKACNCAGSLHFNVAYNWSALLLSIELKTAKQFAPLYKTKKCFIATEITKMKRYPFYGPKFTTW
ncbi:hypothetical protein GDO86_015041 [Hymenochirus boettgeri]|uniref:Uncharacterized protein n=1 Tax=Hymenochirus boettgeri TaxID=247094 RepID=A0A8T2JR91_9PIPI|nr:hypothetical protein GDO86_015041 [Hymenochirus boettgeri]